MKRPEVGYPCKIDKRRVDMSNGIKLKEAEDCWLLSSASATKYGIKEDATSCLIGSILIVHVSKIIDKDGSV